MFSELKRDNKGFTIIEVLIVLAIAGLIMLIVFLAVPALQRNSRNTQRSNDAARVAGAINECLANNNGNLGACGGTAGAQFVNYITIANNQQLIGQGASGLDSYAYAVNTRCNVATNLPVGGGGARAFTIAYLVETQAGTAPRCVGS